MMEKSLNFIEQIIEEDLSIGFKKTNLKFRFPPEPNGYLHIGHVKAICLNFNLALKYGGTVNLRFDDTNPVKEEKQFVDAIKTDITWLGYKWDKECYASDYFDQLYKWAHLLIDRNLAYVDSQNSQEIAAQKGTPSKSGTSSPYRERSIEENKTLFTSMYQGDFKEGEYVLRAKIDMSSPNMLLRDPVIYRIIHKEHHRTKLNWCIYPLYDWTHGESDYIEQISHSLCSLEFKPHRELYDWFLDAISPLANLRPKQREFARMNLSYTVTSKRKLMELIDENYVTGWDDPRMPTISGLRRRGYTPESLRNFIDDIGVAKRDNLIDLSLLEFSVREHLNSFAPRVMGVFNPVKLTIINYPDGKVETLMGDINPENTDAGKRSFPFSKNLYIEREDFKEEASGKFFRLTLGKEVRLKNAYIIKGESIVKDKSGNIVEILCTYDLNSKSGSGTIESQRKVKGTIHWVTIDHSIKAKINIYDRLFNVPSPDKDKSIDFKTYINPDSFKTVDAFVEPSLKDSLVGTHFQFQRIGYFIVDENFNGNKIVFNKTVGLRDNWSRN
jgi:glutaminyl-tRNA synthetase